MEEPVLMLILANVVQDGKEMIAKHVIICAVAYM